MFTGYAPTSLPRPLMAGYQLTPANNVIRTDMEVGTARARRRSAARNDRISLKWRLTDPEMRIFRARYNSTGGWSLTYPHDATAVTGWTNTRTVDVANAITAPDGTLTANYLRSDATASSTHDARYSLVGLPTVDNANYCGSVFAKAGERTWLRVMLTNKAGINGLRYFDLANGLVGYGINNTGRIESFGDGWFRCSVLANMGSGATNPTFLLSLGEGDNDANFSGQYRDGTAQAGGVNTLTLDASASATTGFYVGAKLTLTGGTGAGQSGLITAYDGGSKVATVTAAWATVPNATTTFTITDGLYLWGDNLVQSNSFEEFLPTSSAGNVLGADDGAAWFLLDIASGDGGLSKKECRFTEGYQATALPGLNWEVTAKLEIR